MKKAIALICALVLILSSMVVIMSPSLFAAADDILTAEQMSQKLVDLGAYTKNGDTLTSVAGKDAKSAVFTSKQDFVLDFNAKITANNLQIRIRNKDVTGHSVGYRIFIYSNKISLQKFNDTNWASTEIANVSYDFTKSTLVRVVAKGTNIYVELDGVKKLEINDAVDTSSNNGELRFYGMAGAGNGEFKMVGLYNATIIPDAGDEDEPEELGDDILSLEELTSKFVNSTAYALSGNILKSVSGKEGKSAMLTVQQDFDLKFVVKIPANSLQIRIRNKDVTGHSVGYKLMISKNAVSLQKQNDNNWGATEIANVSYNFAENVEVRIIAKDTVIQVILDGVKKLEISDAIDTSANNGELRFYGMANADTEVTPIYLKNATEIIEDAPPEQPDEGGEGDNEGDEGGNTDDNQGENEGGNTEPDPETGADKLVELLQNTGAYVLNGDVLNTVVGFESKQATLHTGQNFVFDFNVKLNSDCAAGDHLQLRIRHADVTGHSVGYRLCFYKDRVQIEKFNDNNWQSTLIKSVDHKFTENTKVRIAANGNDLWIALDGVKQIILTDAIDTSDSNGALRFYGMNSSVVSEVMPISLDAYSDAAEEGITTPIIDETIIKTASELTNALIRSTAYTSVSGNLVKSVLGLPGKNATLTDSQDFILNFNMKINSNSYGEYVQVRLRCADLKGHSVGYRLYFYKDRVQIEKFNNNNWNSTKIDSADHDFTKMSKVRIVANGKNIWVAVDGEKLLSITDAIDTSSNKGEVRFYGVQGKNIYANVEMVSLLKYDAATANAGIKPEDPSKRFEIKSASEILNALVRSGAYIKNGNIANNVEKMEGKSSSLTDKQNFIFNFKLKFAENASGSLQIRLRSKDLKGHSTGYRVFISKTTITLEKFKDNAWTSKAVASVKHKFSETSEIRIVANEGDLWIAVNGSKIISITGAEITDGGEIRFYGLNTSAICEITPISLMEYSDELANDGIGELIPEVEDDKPVLKPMVLGALNNSNNLSVWTIAIISAAAVLVAVFMVVAVLVIIKNKKVKN